jgi:hypothetical protein
MLDLKSGLEKEIYTPEEWNILTLTAVHLFWYLYVRKQIKQM